MTFRAKPTNYYTPEELLSNGYKDIGTNGVAQQVLLVDESGNPISEGAGKTILNASGTAASSGNNTLIAADAAAKIKVFAFSLTTSSTTATTCIFQDGAGGTELWRVVLQAISGANSGANLCVSPPAWLFGNAAINTLLNLNLSSAQTIHYSLAYYKEA